MKLEEFITNVLIDIDKGLAVAKQKANRNYYVSSTAKGGVHFDIAVTTTSSSGSKAEGSVKVGIIQVLGAGVNTGIEGREENSQASRIQFYVYVK